MSCVLLGPGIVVIGARAGDGSAGPGSALLHYSKRASSLADNTRYDIAKAEVACV